jgi:pseudouridine synthase
MKERLQKILARAGYGSRRSVEAVITGGRVRINGEVAVVGVTADPETDVIEVDGVRVGITAAHVHLAMHKPAGFVTTSNDPEKRRTVMELLPESLPARVFPVGRLDRDTEGLLLFTSDGELAHQLAHPRWEIDKEYAVLVEGVPATGALDALRNGIEIDGRRTAPASAERSAAPPGHRPARADETWLRIVIHEGRKRQVRLMCAAVGHPVRRLVRVRIGDVVLGRLARGTTRKLAEEEVRSLKEKVQLR